MENLRTVSGILDLAIIGGGPAGTAAALEAKRHDLRVGIWERGRFPCDKVCGEFISFEALPWLQAVIPQTLASGTPIHSAEFISSGALARAFQLPGSALGLSRRSLDAALWQAVRRAGIDVHERECVRMVKKLFCHCEQGSTWEIESGEGNVRIAKSLIIACGRWWAIKGLSSPAQQSKSATPGNWVGAKAHFARIPVRSAVEMYLFRGGYCGLAPVEDGACNLCCLVRRGRIREYGTKRLEDFASWLGQIVRLPAFEARLRGAVQICPVVTSAPVHLARGQATQSGALMVGDASGFLDPFTGEGISLALHSGRLAAQVIAESLSGGFSDERAARVYTRALLQAVRRSYKIAAIARNTLLGPTWVQSLVTAPLPWMGKRLVRDTRWHGQLEVSL